MPPRLTTVLDRGLVRSDISDSADLALERLAPETSRPWCLLGGAVHAAGCGNEVRVHHRALSFGRASILGPLRQSPAESAVFDIAGSRSSHIFIA